MLRVELTDPYGSVLLTSLNLGHGFEPWPGEQDFTSARDETMGGVVHIGGRGDVTLRDSHVFDADGDEFGVDEYGPYGFAPSIVGVNLADPELSVHIESSTISDNPDAIGLGVSGGQRNRDGSLELINTTVSGNDIGIDLRRAYIDVRFSTLAFNSSASDPVRTLRIGRAIQPLNRLWRSTGSIVRDSKPWFQSVLGWCCAND